MNLNKVIKMPDGSEAPMGYPSRTIIKEATEKATKGNVEMSLDLLPRETVK